MEEVKEDLKDGTETESTGQDKNEENEQLKERLKKAEEERDNYKQGLLKYKRSERTLSEKKEETKEEEEETQDWDEASKKFQAQTLSEAEKIARLASQKYIEENNEKAAVAKFLDEYPDLAEDESWKEILSNYNPKNGKGTIGAIVKDLKRARVVMLHDRGELDKLAQEAEARGKRKGQAEAFHANAFTSSGSRSEASSDKGSDNVTKGAKEIALAFGIDPKKLR